MHQLRATRGILLETLEHVGPHVTKMTMRQPIATTYPAYLVEIAPPYRFQSLISIYQSCQGAEPNVTIYTCFSTPTPIKDSVGDGGVSAIRRF